jgi:4-amino-4-deoxy-L-arabinose transferase-like glycosyltransferase
MRANRKPRALAIGALGAIALAKLLLHLAVITRYGYFRDELYYLASTEHLSWGYVDHPPFSIALLAVVRAVFGDSLPALRIVPALAGAATVFLTGVIARQLGGGRFAQALAALAALLSPVFLGTDHFYSMNALEILFWTGAASLLLVALDSGRTRDWLTLGALLGLGLLNKLSMSWFCGGLILGLLLTPYRRLLRERGIWLTALVAGVFFLPHILWQIHHGWPTLEFMHNATLRKMIHVSPAAFLLDQVLSNNPGTVPIWLAGIGFGFLAGQERGRVLVWIYLTVFAMLIVGGHSRASYLAPAYPIVFALGSVAMERVSAARGWFWMRPVLAGLVVALGLVALPMALPVLPVETFVAYQSALGLAPGTDERQAMGALPQHYADMFGWENMTALVAEAYARLTPEEQRHARVFGQNYGEAGAVDVLGRRLGLPRAMSSHNSYWLWGPGTEPIDVLIIIGGDREDNAQFFEDIEIVGQTESPWSMPYERGLDVSIARKPKVDLRAAWPRMKNFI